MGHSHVHGHSLGHHEINEKNLLFATILNFVITLAEVIGGLVSNSLSLLSDALHNLSDTLAVLLAYIANRVGKRKSNTDKTFGYKRIEILVALLNATVLVAVSFYLFFEAYKRFLEPEKVKGGVMLIVAVIGLLANLFSVVILKKDSHKNLNVKAAYIHLIGDTLSSVAVIIGGVFIYFYKVYWIDPLVTVIIGLYILKETWSILKETIRILMQNTPRDLDLEGLKTKIESLPGVENIHHIHAWNLTDNQVHFEAHVDLSSDLKMSEAHPIQLEIEKVLKHEYGISHTTIQFEYDCCDDKSMIHGR